MAISSELIAEISARQVGKRAITLWGRSDPRSISWLSLYMNKVCAIHMNLQGSLIL